MTYVDAFVAAVPKANKEQYITHARAAAAMRDAERLVQIEMADIGAVIAGP